MILRVSRLDTVGAGIYSGNVQHNADGSVLWGRQYQDHNKVPGPVYSGNGYTRMAQAIHTGKLIETFPLHDGVITVVGLGEPSQVAALLAEDPALVHEIATGGATPLHTCGMSSKGQRVTETLSKSISGAA